MNLSRGYSQRSRATDDEKRLKEAIRDAQLNDLSRRLGLNTRAGERGVLLSGGNASASR